ncbi:RNA-directed DNA polymerase from mobile element jockey [Trichonephila clavipes]|nr:RNA-directed DNA polymerase from mobile element jockey [Trichonephila clavipes]
MDDTVFVLPKFTVDEIAKHARFLILSLPNNEMSRKSPFFIHKALIGIGGEPKSIKKLRSVPEVRTLTNFPCLGQLTCSTCASVGHASTDCSLEPKCINCLQPHPSDSKLCPKWKIEKQIQEIKTTQNNSYPEARKLIVPQIPQTYAQATKSSTLNNSTQTDENITKINCPPLKLLAPLSSKQKTNIPTAINTSSSAQTQLLPSITEFI